MKKTAKIPVSEKREPEYTQVPTDEYNHASRMLEELFDKSLDIIILVSPEGKVLDINEKGCEITGKSKEESIGVDILDYIHPDDKSGSNFWLSELRKGSYHVQEVRLKTPDDYKYYSVNGRLLKNGNGSAEGAIIILRDINEMVQLEHITIIRLR